MDKQFLRDEIILKRNCLSVSKLQNGSLKIFKNLISLKEINSAKLVFCYLSTHREVDTKRIVGYLIDENKCVCVPKINGLKMDAIEINQKTTYSINKFKIKEPDFGQVIIPQEIEVCIVPGLCFTKNGTRLGYGKGYYDKFLDGLNCFKIGLCLDEFIMENIPKEKTDIKMNCIVTQSRVINCV